MSWWEGTVGSSLGPRPSGPGSRDPERPRAVPGGTCSPRPCDGKPEGRQGPAWGHRPRKDLHFPRGEVCPHPLEEDGAGSQDQLSGSSVVAVAGAQSLPDSCADCREGRTGVFLGLRWSGASTETRDGPLSLSKHAGATLSPSAETGPGHDYTHSCSVTAGAQAAHAGGTQSVPSR